MLSLRSSREVNANRHIPNVQTDPRASGVFPDILLYTLSCVHT